MTYYLYKLIYRFIGRALRSRFRTRIREQVEGICDVTVHVPRGGHEFWCDGYVEEASWAKSGDLLTEDELAWLSSDADFVHEHIIESVY